MRREDLAKRRVESSATEVEMIQNGVTSISKSEDSTDLGTSPLSKLEQTELESDRPYPGKGTGN